MKSRTFVILGLVFLLTLGGQWWFARHFEVTVDAEPDGVIYLALAHNLLNHGVYSAGTGADLVPTYARLPGYPWMIAAIFKAFGDGNQGAVRGFQAVLAALTITGVASLAYLWDPVPDRRRRSAAIAFLLAALCPFTAIYNGIILTETLTLFLSTSLLVTATLAFQARSRRAGTFAWLVAGAVAGAVQLVRPESGLFAAAVGFTLVGLGAGELRTGADALSPVTWRDRWRRVIVNGTLFACAFAVTLAPWTVRNAQVFHRFAPLPPADFSLPGEADYRGFAAWYGTWADSERYLQPFYWDMSDGKDASADDLPPAAFDSEAERQRTFELFARYNAPADPAASADAARAGLTPDLNAAFWQLARERASRSPWRQYVRLPARRAVNLWFVPHAQYFDFEGSLFPLNEMPYGANAHFWLPFFLGLTCLYTVLGLVGGWKLAVTPPPGRLDAWRWLLLVILVIFPRWIYLSTLEHTEPRYMVEIFPVLCVLGGLALSGQGSKARKTISTVPENPPDILAPLPPR